MLTTTPAPMLTTTLGRSRRRARRALLAATLVCCALPGGASAATIGITADGTLSYRGSEGEANFLSVRDLADSIEVTDSAGLKPTRPFNSFAQLCVPVTSQTVRCPERPTAIKRIAAFLNDRNDGASNIHTGLPVTIDGGSAEDRYEGGSSPFLSKVTFAGGSGKDTATYASAGAGARVTNDGVGNDGRIALDSDNIRSDVEVLAGSQFADELSFAAGGTDFCCGLELIGGRGDDVLRAGSVFTFFRMGAVADGADKLVGGTGRSQVDYSGRSRPVNVTLGFGGADDGEVGEGDEVFGGNEHAVGGQAGDTIRAPSGSTVAFSLFGTGGNDQIDGANGPDLINGGAGGDSVRASSGDDRIFAEDGEVDVVGCGEGTDFVELDARDNFGACESGTIGVLRLRPRLLRASAAGIARVSMSWRHPQSSGRLRHVTLRLRRGGATVGAVSIRPRTKTITAHGRVRVVRAQTRLARAGRTVTARLALRVHRSLADERLRLEVEAVDIRGLRQVVRRAGSLRIAS